MVDISIIIVHYKTRDHLRRCLEQLLCGGGTARTEILVVDNASNDGSVLMVARDFPSVRVLANQYNVGFAAANNQAFQLCHGRFVMPLNPDTEVTPRTLDRLVELLNDRPDAGIVAPAISSTDGTVRLPSHRFERFSGSLLVSRLAQWRTEAIPSRGPIEVDWIWGTGYICRREALDTERLFDEETFLFGEEYGLCRRVKRRRFKLFILPEATIRHHASVSYKRDAASLVVARQLGAAVTWLQRRRHFGWLTATLGELSVLIDAFVLWAAVGLKNAVAPASPQRAVMIATYRARWQASIALLIRGEAYFKAMNARARLYFNDGRPVPSNSASQSGDNS
jgi:GT2 family glycosyltransferase